MAEGFDSSSDQENIFEMIIVFFILLNNLIPISLLVTIDIVRFLQGLLIGRFYHVCIKSTGKRLLF